MALGVSIGSGLWAIIVIVQCIKQATQAPLILALFAAVISELALRKSRQLSAATRED